MNKTALLTAWLAPAALLLVPGCINAGNTPGLGADTDPHAAAPPAYRFVQPAVYATHPIAGRSPFPTPGESITEPIAARRFSNQDQFKNPIALADIPDVVPWDRASKYVGHTITVEGRVLNVGQSRDGKVNFLNFHQDWRDKFYMVLFNDLAKTLDNRVEDTFTGKLIRVTGKVQSYRGKPQIRITSMDQVEFVGQ